MIRQAWPCKKKLQALKIVFRIEGVKPGTAKKKESQPQKLFFSIFFGTALVNTITSPAFQKNNFSGCKIVFFRMPLVKSANSTSDSLPRLSSLQIAQMRTIHN